MQHSSTNGVATSTPNTPASPLTLEATVMYRSAPPVLRALLLQDRDAVVGDGLDLAEYLEGVEEYHGAMTEAELPHAAAHYLAESWRLAPDGSMVLSGEGSGADAAAAFMALAGETPDHQDKPGTAPATEPTVDAGKELADKAAAAVEAEELAMREAVVTAVKAMVKSLRQGERALCRGYLDAGMYAHQVVQGKLRLGDKRASAVQLVEGQLALYASDSVDANRLIRCWAAYDLLCVGQGLEKQAANVPYGVYRDAWSLLVERADKDTAEERYVLLPGVEQMCRDHFKRSTVDGLSKAACIDWAKVVQREALVVVAKAAAVAEAEAKAQRLEAERVAAEARKQTQAAAKAKQQAADDAEQAKADAVEAEEAVVAAVKTGDPVAEAAAKAEADRLAAELLGKLAAAEQAKAVAHAKALADEKARLDAELKAKQEARAKEEARVASERQATAEARKAEQDRKAKEREAAKGQPRKAPEPGVNLVPTAKDATAKDVAAWMAASMLQNADPDLVFVELLTLLIHAPTDAPVKAFKAESVQDAIMAAAWAIRDAAEKQGGEQEPSDAEVAKLEAAGVA